MTTTHATSGPCRRELILMVAAALALLPGALRAKRAGAQSFDILYPFTGQGDGGQPIGGLIRDAQGNFYGATC